MTREECISQQNDVEWIKHPEWWRSIWGHICTLKRTTGKSELIRVGYIRPDQPLPVYTGLMTKAPEAVHIYTIPDAIVADGWRVA